MLIQSRREDADAQFSGQYREDAAAYAALGRDANPVYPLAGVVVHAAARHDAKNPDDVLRGRGTVVSDWVNASVRQRRSNQGQVATIDRYGALSEIEVQNRFWLVAEDIEVAKHMAYRAVSMASGFL